MGHTSEYIWFLKFKILNLTRQVEAFQNGDKYVSLQKEHEAECRKLRRRIRELEEEVARSHTENAKSRNGWIAVLDDMEKEHAKESAALRAENKKMEERMFRAEKERDDALDKAKEWRGKFYDQSAEMEKLEGMNAKLTAQVNKDFQNSSIPSSQQGPGRKKIPNNREKSGKKRGGQPGHEGHRLTQMEPTETHVLPDPAKYADSPDYRATETFVKRQRIVLSVEVKVVEYQARVFRNIRTGGRAHADFPDGFASDISYDDSVKAFAFLLANEGNMSAGKIRELLCGATGGKLNISEASINGLCREFSEKSEKERAAIIQDILTSPTVNADFTNANVNGGAKQVLILASPGKNVTLFVARDHKGHEGVKGTPLENYVGTIVHDHDTTFYSYGLAHQECMQHNIRYLIGSTENEPGREWNKEMLALVREMLHYHNKLGGEEADPETVAAFEKKYDEILEKAGKEYADVPPSDYYKEGYNLYRRLQEYKESELRFLHSPQVPSNNSLAERKARLYKRKQKQATVLRSDAGFAYLCDALSVIDSIRQEDGGSLYAKAIEIFSRKKPEKEKPET